MSATSVELARRYEGTVIVRPQPLRLTWRFDDLVTSDGHRLFLRFTCGIRAIDDPAQKQMLAETFLQGDPTADDRRVVEHFAPALRAEAGRAVERQTISHWLSDDGQSALAAALRAAADGVAFACGVEALPPLSVDLQSPTLDRQRIDQMQRSLAERRAEDQLGHFQRAAQLLKQFDELRRTAPGIAPAELLRQISPSDQGPLLQMLLLARGRNTAPSTLWAVAGNSLVRTQTAPSSDGVSRTAQSQLTKLPDALGPLRSVRIAQRDGRAVLLIGARSGVMVLDPARSDAPATYADSVTSNLGFNRAVLWGDEIWACHGEAGLVCWEAGQGAAPSVTIRPAELPVPMPTAPAAASSAMTTGLSLSPGASLPGVRNLQVLDEQRLIFSCRHTVLAYGRDGRITALASDHRCDVVAILPVGDRVLVVHEDGLVAIRDRSSLSPLSQSRPAGRVVSAAIMPWLGGWRLLLASADGPVFCVAPEDPLVTQYRSAYRGIRSIVAAEDLVAGISPDRQRLVLWDAWEPARPACEVPIFPLAHHRLADLDIV